MRKQVALIFCFDAGGRLLMGKRRDSGKWTLPGGNLEPGECPCCGAKRELREETSLFPYSLSPMPGFKPNPPELPQLHIFSALVGGLPHGHSDPDRECQHWQFIDVSDGLPPEIDAVLHGPPGDLNVIRQMYPQAERGVEKSEDDDLEKMARLDPSEGYTFLHEPATPREIQMGLFAGRVTAWAPGVKPQPGFKNVFGEVNGLPFHHSGGVGMVLLRHKGNTPKSGKVVSEDTWVHPDHRRKGIASAMYAHAEKSMGAKIVPSAQQSGNGRSLWRGNKQDPQFGKAEEELHKRISDLSAGTPMGSAQHGAMKGIKYDYSHHLTPEQRSAGYGLHVLQHNTDHGGGLSAIATHNNEAIGTTVLVQKPNEPTSIEPHSTLNEEHRKRGLGSAMYSAAYRHAQTMGIKKVAGGAHTAAAGRVHESLNRKHGLGYQHTGSKGWLRPDYSYELKSEMSKGELLDHHDSRERELFVRTQHLNHKQLMKACLDANTDVRHAALQRPEVDEHTLHLLAAARVMSDGYPLGRAIVDFLSHSKATKETAEVALRSALAHDGPGAIEAVDLAREALARYE